MVERPKLSHRIPPMWPIMAALLLALLPSLLDLAGLRFGYRKEELTILGNLIAAVEIHGFLETLSATAGVLCLAVAIAHYRNVREGAVLVLATGFFWSGIFHAIHAIAPLLEYTRSGQEGPYSTPITGPGARFFSVVLIGLAMVSYRFSSRNGRNPRTRLHVTLLSGLGIAFAVFSASSDYHPLGSVNAHRLDIAATVAWVAIALGLALPCYLRDRSVITYTMLLGSIPMVAAQFLLSLPRYHSFGNKFFISHWHTFMACFVFFIGLCAHTLQAFKSFRERMRARQDRMVRVLREHAENLGHQVENRTVVEKALLENLELFEQLATTIHQVFWMTDPLRTSTIYASPGYEKVWKRSCQSLYENSRSFLDAVHPDDRARIEFALSKLATGLYDEEYRIILPDNTVRWIRDRGYPVESADGKVERVVGIAEDITPQKEAEQIISEQRLKMVSSSKMSSLGEMAGGIAHEINNPLAVIHTRAGQLKELAELGKLDMDLVRTAAERIEQTVMRISKIVKGLRSFARDGDADPFQVSSLRTIIYDTLEFCREKFKHHHISINIGDVPESLMVECRPTQISQLLLNLISNAYDAVEKLPEKWIQLDVIDHATSVDILITDSGRGIPAQVAERIFQPFFTTKDIGKGTGLGLSICKGILEVHQGDLSLDRDCPYTRFVIHLPKRQDCPLEVAKAG